MKRGWVLDEVVRIGHIEAALSHIDELLSDEDIDRLTISYLEWLAKSLYAERVEIMNNLAKISGVEQKYWCLLKHCATDFVIACENRHSVGIDITRASKNLAMACSLFFGFSVMECLRCLDEKLEEKNETN